LNSLAHTEPGFFVVCSYLLLRDDEAPLLRVFMLTNGDELWRVHRRILMLQKPVFITDVSKPSHLYF